MKTYLNYSQRNQNINNDLLIRKHKCKAEQKNSESIISRENKELNRPARAISFGGSAGLSKSIKKIGKSAVELANEKAVIFNSFYALIVAGILKPMAVLNMPGSEDKDKQIVATKNFLQAFIGSFLSFTIGGKIISKAVDTINDIDLNLIKVIKDNEGKPIDVKAIEYTDKKALEIAREILIKENGKKNKGYIPTIDQIVEKSKEIIEEFSNSRLKHFSKNPEFIEELVSDKTVTPSNVKNAIVNATQNLPRMFQAQYSEQTIKDGYKVFWERSTEFLTAIGKAKISSVLLPGVMAFLFAKKNLEKQMTEEAKKNTLKNNSTFKAENEQFRKMLNKNNSQIPFKGSFNAGITSIVESMANSTAGSKLAHWMAGFNKPSARMGDIESVAITAYWLQNTARSKKIEPSQKLGLNVHTALVTVISSTASFIIDWALDFLIDNSKDKYKVKLNEIIEKVKGNMPQATLESIFAQHGIEKEVHKMAIRDEIKKVLNNNTQNAEFDSQQIIDTLKGYTKHFGDISIDKGLIEKIKQLLDERNIFESKIKELCDDMINSKLIAKVLSETDLRTEKDVKAAVEVLVEKYGKSLSKFKSLTIFTLVVRFLVPVLMVPFSGKLKKKVAKWQEERQAQKIQNAK